MRTITAPECGSSFRNVTTLIALAIASTVGPDARGQSWVNPGTGDWFTAGNWLPATVPTAGGVVVVSNGGTAQLSGVLSTPILGALSVGIGGTGTGTGVVQSDGVAILTTSGFSIGFANGNAAAFAANGALTITGAGAQGSGASVGTIFSTTAAGTATGTMSIAGSLAMPLGSLSVGQTLGAARGSTANGSLAIGGDAGTAFFTTVGAVIPLNAGQVGTQATGALSIGGSLAVAGGFMNIGTVLSQPVAGFVDQAHGTATIGSLSFASPVGVSVGFSNAGIAHGELHVDSVDTTAGRADFLSVGVATQGGSALGRMTAISGDLRTGGALLVGSAAGLPGVNTTADGSLSLGGALSCVANCSGLTVGNASGSGLVTSVGSVTTVGLSGFTGYAVGLLSGSGLAAGSSARGTLISTGSGSAGANDGVNVGTIITTTAAGTAPGTMSVAGSLPINGSLAVGATIGAARGSIATGSLTIGGDAGSTFFTTVGAAFPSSPAQVGTRATGALAIGGSLTLLAGGLMNIGVATSTPVATFFDQVHGTATIGTLRFSAPDTAGVSVTVGLSNGGIAHGELHVDSIDTTAGRADVSSIGVASQGGSAFGRLTATSGDVRTSGGLSIGAATSAGGVAASADGLLSLGGHLSCVANCFGVNVGTAGGAGLVTARGHATASSFSGYSSYGIGVLNNATTAASFADGTLIASAGGVNSPAFFSLQVGTAFNSASGTSATGLARVTGGNIGTFQFVSIGTAIESAGTTIGTLELTGGTLSAPQFLIVGALFNDSAPTALADGTLRVTNGGIVTSSLFGPAATTIGFARGGGDATGRLIATDATLVLGAVTLGVNSSAEGSANGTIELTRSTLDAEQIFAGFGNDAAASILLDASRMNVATTLSLTNGRLALDNSFADIGGTFALGGGATLAIDVDGLLRGFDYGAIDTLDALLAGALTLSFEDLTPVGNRMAFDLIVSGSATGITGDFDSVAFTGVPVGYSLFAGTVVDGVEIFRVRLVRNAVPEPATLLLLTMALVVMFASRRREPLPSRLRATPTSAAATSDRSSRRGASARRR